MKLGKFPAKIDRRTILLGDVAPSLPEPIDLIDWYRGISSWGVMGNDVHGDCTCAALGHAEQTITANCPEMSELTPTDKQVLQLYAQACGWDPTQPWTDRGGFEIDVLNFVRKNDLFGVDSLLGYAAVDPHNLTHIKQAIAYFGGVYIGLQLPDSAVSGDLVAASWNLSGTIKPNPYNGHAVWIAGYNATGPLCCSWGAVKQASWAFFEACCDEAYALLLKNWLAQYGSMSGMTVVAEAMQNALQRLTG